MPHSLVVMADPGADNLPLQAGREQAAFPARYSKSPEQGISAGDHDTVSFKADEAGDFLWFCGVPGHGQSGMWIRFEVINGAEAPYIMIAAVPSRAAPDVRSRWCWATRRGSFPPELPAGRRRRRLSSCPATQCAGAGPASLDVQRWGIAAWRGSSDATIRARGR